MSKSRDVNERPDLIALGGDRLSPQERRYIRFVRSTFRPGRLDMSLRWLQRHVGSTWIHHSTKNLLQVHGTERLPPLDPKKSYIFVSNHRSFFDMYVITGYLVRRGLPHRIVFPVRSSFFYDGPLGLAVNGVMSFFAMYPPIFRERKRAALNLVSLAELGWLLRRGGVFTGIHPEGTRNKGDDPYSFLPAQSGVGRVVHEAKVAVIPAFINGLGNDLPKQILGNFDGTGPQIHLVFGEAVALDDLLAIGGSPKVHRAIAERCLESIQALGEEERKYRSALSE